MLRRLIFLFIKYYAMLVLYTICFIRRMQKMINTNMKNRKQIV